MVSHYRSWLQQTAARIQISMPIGIPTRSGLLFTLPIPKMSPLRKFLIASSWLLISSAPLSAAPGISSGPMLGPIEMREALVWVQTDDNAIVRVVYTNAESGEKLSSLPVETDAQRAHTATLRLNRVKPGQRYNYQIEINGELVPGRHEFETPAFYHGRTPPPDFTIAVGGAHYVVEEGFEPPYQILGGGYGIFETILEAKPKLMLWLGNTAHLRESDWTSRTGYLERFSQARSPTDLAPLLANIPQYATWSEADYGSPLADATYSFRQYAEDAFRAFWPQPVTVKAMEGIGTHFRYADVDFFLLDTRSHRSDNPSGKEISRILGREQVEWLRRELLRSKATFKVIAAGAPILNPADNRSHLSYAREEHTELLQMFRNEATSGLFFLSGGKYHGELTRLVHAGSYNIYDLTLGPLTANPRKDQDELNFFRMPGTSTFERHFALLDFSGPEEARELTMRIMSAEGKVIWSRTVPASELQPPEE